MSASSSPGDGDNADNADPVIVVLTADTATLAESRERALAERAAKRQAISTRKRMQSKDRQAFGVTLMKIKNYEGAAGCFADACALWRSNAVCHCDLATAYLHLGRFEDAEAAASTALALDPKLVEARYARAMARKGRGLVRGAIADFETVLKLAPENEAAQIAARELRASLPAPAAVPTEDAAAADAPGDAPAAADPVEAEAEYDLPALDAERLEVESSSDTSDAQHTGTGVPCLFYNHQGCARGNSCKFSHAPDEKSVRDGLGKNVCLYFLLGQCKFEAKCIYSHSRAALSATRGWWNDAAQTAAVKRRIEDVKERGRVQREERERERKEKGGRRKGKGKGKSGGRTGGGQRGGGSGKRSEQVGGQEMWAQYGVGGFAMPGGVGGFGMGMPMPMPMPMGVQMGEEEMEQRMANMGFTDYDLNELAAQGVKPWDDDAGAVLAALSY
ncbi:hypothetical protein B0H17DRAFT_1338006 [Mycena rosella]|uniref:C3H1-type domain-containing protein n=1 Tax=Mycena rosella TaxID=1033263 RepID=A0AAD7CP86_MYCRO|nr:hypothetical protein B0H17DRAFT_1338006 [Mycena rosella]